MLDSLRGFAKSWPGKIMGGFLLVGIAGFGINNVITGLGSQTVARVGGTEISSNQFIRAYQQQINGIAQQMGSMPTADQAMEMGIPSSIIQNLAQNAALDEMASGFGLGVSEQKLSDLLREDPNFQNALGQFDPSNFSQVLQASGYTESEYFQLQTNSARRQQLVLSLFGDVKLPDAASSLLHRYGEDQRTIDYFALSEANIESPAAPTDEELGAYLTEHQSEFRTVETRKVQLLRLSAADLANTIDITDDAIAAEYERTQASFTQAERRTIQQVPLNVDQVTAFQAGLDAGTPFDTLVTEAGLTPTDLGSLTQAGITDTNLASAAFALPEGGFSIIAGVGGQRAVHVSAIEAAGTQTLDEAREQIRNNLALAQARDQLSDVQDQIEELRAAFRPLSEIADRFGLDLYEADVTSGGTQLSVVPDLSAEDQPRLTQAIFKATEGSLTPAVPLAGNAQLWFDLNGIEPARDQTLDEVRDQVVAALTSERVNDAIMAAQADAVTRLDNGEALADVAASYNVFPQISMPFTRFGAQDGTVDRQVASAAFAGDSSHHGSAVGENGEFVVFQVTSLMAADGPLPQTENETAENQVRNDMYGDFVMAIRDQAGLRINQQALTDAMNLVSGSVQ